MRCFVLVLLTWLQASSDSRASGSHPPHHFSLQSSSLESALEAYRSDREHLPFAEDYLTDTVLRTDAKLYKELSKYASPCFNDRNWLRSQKAPSLLDPWGNPYFILIDYDLDGTLTEPANLGDLTFTDRSFLLWSAGPDGKYGTFKTNLDNLYNYPGHTLTYETLIHRKSHTTTILFIQILISSLIVAFLWFSKIRTYPLFANLYGEVFTNYYRRHLKRARRLILPAIGIEILFGLLVLKTSWFEPVVLPSFILSLACLSLVFLQIPKLLKLTPETSITLAHLTLIPAALWSIRLVALIHSLTLTA